jgi:ABC-2 type transport system permease protein
VEIIEQQESIDAVYFETEAELRTAVRNGSVDGGIILPEGFDQQVEQGDIEIPLLIWGESLAKDRAVLIASVSNGIRDFVGQETPVDIQVISLGNQENIPWDDRLLPIIVLFTVFVSGFVLPAISLLNEKEKKTIDALMATPLSIGEIFLAKGTLGVIVGIFMGIVILAINQVIGEQTALLILMLFLSTVMAAALGLMLGSIVNSIQSFFGNMKLINIFLFAPALFYLFPGVPEWAGRIFPTYYIIEPIFEITQRNGTWSDIYVNVIVATGLNLVFIGLLLLLIRRKRQYAT